MGTAGLNVRALVGLLERMKIECLVVDGDSAFDHCVLRLSSVKRPGVVAFLEYENQGFEPRLVGMKIGTGVYGPIGDDFPLEWEQELRISGARRDDAEKIAAWVRREFLEVKEA